MSKLRPELYIDREQTFVKHFVLEFYLEKLAYKIGMSWNGATLNYVDGFAGPWQNEDENLADTSPHIAVRVLRTVSDEVQRLGKPPLLVRAMFVEKDADKFRELLASFPVDPSVAVHPGEFEARISEAIAFGSYGSQPFCFTFIDPCGWKGYGLDAITPLLRVDPGEVLINFMFDEINRFVDLPDPANASTFRELFGSTDFRDAWVGLSGIERQEAIVAEYCQRVRGAGRFRHVGSAVILNPLKDRAHYHLVYATRHDEGLRTFRDAERRALREQETMRAGAQQRKRHARSGGQAELFGADVLATPYIDTLRSRYHERARRAVVQLLTSRPSAPFDELVLAGMQHPMTSEQDVRDFLMDDIKRGALIIEGRVGKGRTPPWHENHVIRRVQP
jgi:three-Cys-motif partner protein